QEKTLVSIAVDPESP
ncbi:hypothetical protein R8Z66_07915, partial [Escherichia coli]